MKSRTEKVICCEVKKIHNPKPKRLYKINDCFKGHSRFTPGPRKIPNYNTEMHRKKGFEFTNKNKFNKLDFDSISFEEIENDFMAIKAKSEAIKVENELLRLLLEPSNKEKKNIKNNRIKRLSNDKDNYNLNFQNKK